MSDKGLLMDSREIVLEVIEEMELHPAIFMRFLSNSVKRFVNDVGYPASYYTYSKELVLNQKGQAIIPSDFLALKAGYILFANEDRRIQIPFAANGKFSVSSSENNYPLEVSNTPGPYFHIDKTSGCFFVVGGDMEQYKALQIEYVGDSFKGGCGILIPKIARSALYEFLLFQATRKNRRQNRNIETQQEEQLQYQKYLQYLGDLKGRLKAASPAELYEYTAYIQRNPIRSFDLYKR